MHISEYGDNGLRMYTMDDYGLEIQGSWLFKKTIKFNWEICYFTFKDNYIDLFGGYPKDKYIEIKKFFYDNYPTVQSVEPRKNGVRIYFNTNIRLVHNSN